MTDRELLETARLVHERTANASGHRRAGCFIHMLVASFGAVVGVTVAGGPGLVLGVGVPLGYAISRFLRMLVAEGRAVNALGRSPELCHRVEELHRELEAQPDLRFEVRTPRAINVYQVLLRGDLVLAGSPYPEWWSRDEFEIEPPGPGGATRVRLGTAWKAAFITPEDYAAYASKP